MFSGFTAAIGAHSISNEIAGFSPLWFPRGKIFVFFLCGCACLSFSDLLAYGYAVMMLNVIRSDITIKTHQL